jgi:hypothetical protein
MHLLTKQGMLATAMLSLIFSLGGNAQDGSTKYEQFYHLPDKFFNAVSRKSGKVKEGISKVSERQLQRLRQRERKIYRQLAKKDSSLARQMQIEADTFYSNINARLTQGNLLSESANVYSGHIDSMSTVLKFINSNHAYSNALLNGKIGKTLDQYRTLQNQFNSAETINQIITQRQQMLLSKLSPFQLPQLKELQKMVYYYREKIDQYRQAVSDPLKMESVLLSLASKIPAFRNFFAQNSQLGSLFQLPGASTTAQNLNGMQTRALLQQTIQGRFGTASNMQQNVSAGLQNAQDQINELKKKITRLGKNGSDLEMPDFRPNQQKSKSFIKRLEVGAGMQNSRGSYFFPNSSDLSLQVGYKLNSRSIMGVGASYKLGFGRGWKDIRFTNEGVGFKSYVDLRIKGNIWCSGGAELNYLASFRSIEVLQDFSPWQKSIVAGITKKTQFKGKKANVQVLYDFLYRQHTPDSKPLLFRFNYTLK